MGVTLVMFGSDPAILMPKPKLYVPNPKLDPNQNLIYGPWHKSNSGLNQLLEGQAAENLVILIVILLFAGPIFTCTIISTFIVIGMEEP